LPRFVHPSSVVTQAPHPTHLSLSHGDLREPKNEFFYTIKITYLKQYH
jgi:hypothetical protein